MKLTLPRILAAVLSGLLLPVISPPHGHPWLHWFAFVPLLWALREDDRPGDAVLSWIAGFTGVHTLFFWLSESIVRFSNLPPFLGMQTVHLFALFFSLPYLLVFTLTHPLRRLLGTWWVLGLPVLMAAVELWGPALFPYHQGVSQYRVLPVWQLASVTGAAGITVLLLLVNCVLAEWIYRRREGRRPPWAATAAAAAAVGLAVAWGAHRLQAVEARVAAMPVHRFSQVQTDLTMEERRRIGARDATLRWARLTAAIAPEHPEIVVWPEGATPYDPRDLRVGQLMGSIARNVRAPIVFGGGYVREERDEDGRAVRRYRNAIYYMDAAGRIQDRYDKMVPLPFGEYIPFADTFPVLKKWLRGPGDFEAGERAVVFRGPGFTFTTPICYEAILGRFVRRELADADMIVNVTNDAWFGDTMAPHQHAMLAAVRAVELGMTVYRLGYSGVSMVVTPSGRILHETRPFEQVARVVDVPVGRVDTAYRRVGPALEALLGLAGLALLGALLARRTVTPRPDGP